MLCQRLFFSLFLLLMVLVSSARVSALGEPSYVVEEGDDKHFPLVDENSQAVLYVSSLDHKGVVRAMGDLQKDIRRVTGRGLKLATKLRELRGNVVFAGTIGASPVIDKLVSDKKINIDKIKGKWEAYHIQVVEEPIPGIPQGLVIAGADRRGTTFGIYDLSEQIGVSPWYYWADVPIEQKEKLFVLEDTLVQDAPEVQYRGIFLNDEAPALTSWAEEKFGGFNHKFYVKVFELLLRLKANFLWPAMWDSAFADDDKKNMILADEYGIVMSTSHHEPMMRADKEWNRYGKGPWEYSKNKKNIQKFWEKGAKRNQKYESVYTLGMRGQQDTPMSEGENIGLLEKIVADQREILGNTFKDRDISDIPQVWCLYKEVQSFYENGMRVPDDVILLWSDDNWGNIRRLPTPEERARSGGAGVYYHFDYVGGPRSYRWINTTPVAKIWEQMYLAWKYDATKIWITNVGDLKPMEVPTEFFLRMAWQPKRWTRKKVEKFGVLWATREFGEEHAAEIAALVAEYTRHNGRRKPELQDATTYNLLNYNEAQRIERELQDMVERATQLYDFMPEHKKNAFFQLVLHPVKASATLTQMYIASAKNRLYAEQGRASANKYGAQVRQLFQEDAELKQQYHSFNNGKWNGFMNQSHIGYRHWNNPGGDQMPIIYEYQPGDYAEAGVAVEGIERAWPESARYQLEFNQTGKKSRWLQVFNRGTKAFNYTIEASADWIELSKSAGEVSEEDTVWVSINWDKLPAGKKTGSIKIRATSWEATEVSIVAQKPKRKLLKDAKGFVEEDGYISIEAASFSKSKKAKGYTWREIPQHGRTVSSVAMFPARDKVFEKPEKGPYLEYELTFLSKGEARVHLLLAPTWPLLPGRTLKYGVAFDGEDPQIVEPLKGFEGTKGDWGKVVSDGVRVSTSLHKVEPGATTLRIYGMEPAVAIQKIIIDTGGLKNSYLGPVQSKQY